MSWLALNKIPVHYDINTQAVVPAPVVDMEDEEEDEYGDSRDLTALLESVNQLEVQAPPPLLPANTDSVDEWLAMLRPPDEYISRPNHATVHYPRDLHHLTRAGKHRKDKKDAEAAQLEYESAREGLDMALQRQVSMNRSFVSAY